MNSRQSEIVRRSRTTTAERARWVARFSQSGLTQRAFAAKHDLGLSTLQRWLAQSRSAQPSVPVQWQEVQLPLVHGAHRWAAELARPDGVTLRVALDAPAALVTALWRVASC